MRLWDVRGISWAVVPPAVTSWARLPNNCVLQWLCRKTAGDLVRFGPFHVLIVPRINHLVPVSRAFFEPPARRPFAQRRVELCPLECSTGPSSHTTSCIYHFCLCRDVRRRLRAFPAHLVLDRIFRVDVAGAGSAFNLWRTGGRRLAF